jgi:hypothetical protein
MKPHNLEDTYASSTESPACICSRNASEQQSASSGMNKEAAGFSETLVLYQLNEDYYHLQEHTSHPTVP